MVALDITRAVNDSLTSERPLCAVFVGGTSGIGERTVRALAAHHDTGGPGLKVYIIGRNTSAAQSIIADCKELAPRGEFRFIKATDLSLLKEVDSCSEELIRLEKASSSDGNGCIDMLFMSHADFPFVPRRDTSERLEKLMSFLYYSRVRFIMNLLPLLLASRSSAHIISVYGAGLEKKADWHPDDLLLRRPGLYSLAKARTHVNIMTTFAMEKLAKENAGKLSLVHVFPGLVITPTFTASSNPLWFRALWFFFGGIAKRFFSVNINEIGDRMLYLASSRFPPMHDGTNSQETKHQTNEELGVAISTDGTTGGGAYSCKHTGEVNQIWDLHRDLRSQGTDNLVWKHTMTVFEQISGTGEFSG